MTGDISDTQFVVFSHGAIALLNCPQYGGVLSAVLYGSLRSPYALCSVALMKCMRGEEITAVMNPIPQGSTVNNTPADEHSWPGRVTADHTRRWLSDITMHQEAISRAVPRSDSPPVL